MKRFVIALIFLPFLSCSQKEVKEDIEISIETTELATNVHRLLVNNAVAVVAYVGADGILLVDAAYQQSGNALKKELETLSSKPLKFIINTHIHGDHTGGNLVLGEGVDIIAHENAKKYLSEEQTQGERIIEAFPEYARPNITFSDRLSIEFNGETIEMFHLPGGHTNGDIIIYFPKSNVLVVGDLLFANYFPYVDVGNGGNPFTYLKNIDWIIQNFPNDAIIVGGHGPVYSMDEYRDYRKTLGLTIDKIKKHKANGMSQEDMKSDSILKEWENYGSFFISEDRWIDTIYPYV